MYRKLKKDRRGFTLVELIVVIAILGVLMAILVPQYIQYIEKSRKAVCENSRGELIHYYDIERASDESTDYAALWKTAAQSTKMTVSSETTGTLQLTGNCPDKGTYTLTYNTQTGELLSFNCSKHGTGKFSQTLTGSNAASAIGSSLLAELNDSKLSKFFSRTNGASIDSEGTGTGGWTAAMKDALKNSGISLTDTTIWKVYKKGTNYYIYIADLSESDYAKAKKLESVTVNGTLLSMDKDGNMKSSNETINISEYTNKENNTNYAQIKNTHQ